MRTDLPCHFCGAPYLAHEEDIGEGLRAHVIRTGGTQPQEGQMHFYIPNTNGAKALLERLIQQYS
jgi:hypothetical protein